MKSSEVIKFSLGISLIIAVFLYLVGAFGNWNWNPANWASDMRGFLGIAWLVMSFITVVGVTSVLNENG